MVTEKIKKVANAILDAGEGCQSGLVYVDPVEAAKAAIAVLEAPMVTEKMIEAFGQAFWPCNAATHIDVERDNIRAALDAALSTDAEPVKTAPSVAVKEIAPADVYKLLKPWADTDAIDRDYVTAISRKVAAALSAQVQDVAGLESNPVTLRWWCQQLLDIIENYNISHEACEEDIALLNDIRAAVDPASELLPTNDAPELELGDAPSAELIAAAPDLLEAVKTSWKLWIEYGQETDPEMPVPAHHREMERQIESAIAKAEGRTPAAAPAAKQGEAE